MGETLRIPTSFVVIEFIGTLAAAISGIRLASAKKFDWFGAYIVGMATATGGGTLRDILLGLPPFWLTNPMYVICCAVALGLVIAFGRKIIRENNTWFIFDTIGLALFNIVGLEKTLNMGYPVWTAIAMGCITGAAGGIIRDMRGVCHRLFMEHTGRNQCRPFGHHRHHHPAAGRKIPLELPHPEGRGYKKLTVSD